MDIKKKLKGFMLEEFQDAGYNENISDDESLFDNNIIDSLSTLKLISFLDDEFDVFPEDGELNPENIDTVNMITKFISVKIDKNN